MKLLLGEMTLRSPAFQPGGQIPKHHANKGDNVPPTVEWAHVPSKAKELALIVHDPDAPLPRGFTHWVVYGIPPTTTSLSENDGDAHLQGKNSAGKAEYMGPAPPPGHGPHHYYFTLYALDRELGLKPGLDREQLLAAIEGHVIEQCRLVGVYEA